MLKDQTFWLHKLVTLRVDRSHGDPATHKPLLLLVILEMAEKGEIQTNQLPMTPDLAFRFSVFWSVVSGRRKQAPDVRLPFYHLKSSGIWEPLTADGKPAPHKDLTAKATINIEFLNCLKEKSFRDKARFTLITSTDYFRLEERLALASLLKLPKTFIEGQVGEKIPEYSESIQRGRDARFRIEVVVVAYKHTCALTGYRMTTLEMESIVDAAHIHEFKDSRNNDPRNGLALSKNAHWQFDRGLWSINDDYRVVVNRERFIEEGVPGQKLADFNGHRIFLPGDPKYWPDQTHLEWHRKHKFQS